MHRNRHLLNGLLATAGFALAMVAAPTNADAAFRLGVDGIWVPVSADNVESDSQSTELDSSHKLDSFGGAVHANIGFDIFSIGLKGNYFNEGMEVDSTGVRREEVDINAMARIGVPGVSLGVFGEAGLSINPDPAADGIGYNAGLATEYTIVSPAIIDLNVGLEGQYVNLPTSLHGNATTDKSVRFMTFVGVDFGL